MAQAQAQAFVEMTSGPLITITVEEYNRLKAENAELRQAITGRTVSCSNCNRLAAVVVAAEEIVNLIEANLSSDLREAIAALREGKK